MTLCRVKPSPPTPSPGVGGHFFGVAMNKRDWQDLGIVIFATLMIVFMGFTIIALLGVI